MVQFSWPGKQLIKEESARGVPFFPTLAGVNYWRPEVVGLMHNSGKGTYLFTNVTFVNEKYYILVPLCKQN